MALTPIAAFDITADGRALPPRGDAPPPDGWRWLHLELSDPALPDWAAANMPPVAATALLQAQTRPRCDVHEEGLIINLRAINLNPGQQSDDMVSLRLWVTTSLVVTVRKRKVYALDNLRGAATNGTAPATTGDFVERLAKELTDDLETVSLALEDDTDALEEAIFEREDIEAEGLATTRRVVIRLRRHIGPQRDALQQLARLEGSPINRHARRNIAETTNRVMRSVEELDAVSARLAALQDHVNTAHAARMGRNGYLLGVVAAIFLPLGFLTGLFGVNVAGMPGTASPWAFAVLTLAMVGIGIGLYLLFRLLRWL